MQFIMAKYYAVVVVASAFGMLGMNIGINQSLGAFYVLFYDAFDAGPGLTSLTGSTQAALMALGGPVVSMLIHKAGLLVVIVVGSILAAAGLVLCSFAQNIYMSVLTFGVLTGIGFSMTLLPTIMAVNQYFTVQRNRNIAFGTAACGSGIGTIIVPPLVRYLINSFNWRIALQIMGVSLLGIAVLGSLATYKPKTKRRELADANAAAVTPANFTDGLKRILPTVSFVCYATTCTAFLAGFLTVNLFIAKYVMEAGVVRDADEAAVVMSIVAFAGLAGRVFFTLLNLWPPIQTIDTFLSAAVTCCLSVVGLAVAGTYPFVIAASCSYGFFSAAYPTLHPALGYALFNPDQVTIAIGFMNSFQGLANLGVLPAGAFVRWATGSYSATMLLSAGLYGISALGLLIPYARSRQIKSPIDVSTSK